MKKKPSNDKITTTFKTFIVDVHIFMKSYEDNVSGFKVTGSWTDIVSLGERITFAFTEIEVDAAEQIDEWEEWRPKTTERLNEDVKEKTVKEASVSKSEGEKKDKKPMDDFSKAKEQVKNSDSSPFYDWLTSIGYLKRGLDTVTRKSMRKVEENVYKNLMTKISPLYFDNELISANISKIEKGKYVFEININDDEIKEAVRTQLEKQSDEHDRWHIHTEKEIEHAKQAEGHEVSEDDTVPKEQKTDPDRT